MAKATKTITEKTCTRCIEVKPVGEFYTVARSHCKECERVSANERMKRYGATFRGKCAQAYQTAQKAVRKVEAEHGIEVTNTLTLLEIMFTLSQKECTYCGRETEEKDRTLDHITPIRYSKLNTFDNVSMACATCNRSKSDMPAIMYMIQSCDAYEARTLVDIKASRSAKTFKEAFLDLAEDAKVYFAEQAMQATKRAEQI